MTSRTIKPIGYVRTDFKEKFGVPRQSGRAPSLQAVLIFEKEYRTPEALRGIEDFSHLWLLFDFSLTRDKGWSPTVRPPRLGGNTRVGVFASRSPFRPNHIGLSCVKLERVEHTQEGDVLIISGADLVDGTPVFDVKPYLPLADCIQGAHGGYSVQGEAHKLRVIYDENVLSILPKEKRKGLIECLADDPRPAYEVNPEKVYGMTFADFEVRFQADETTLTITEIIPF